MQNWKTALKTLDGAYADATMRAYQADIQAYVAWCEDTQNTPFPTTTSQVCAFLEDEARDKAPSTVQRRLYALRKIHSLFLKTCSFLSRGLYPHLVDAPH
jgi:site-specific recombinase XerD